MADKFDIRPIGPASGVSDTVKVRWVDMGDGTYAEYKYANLIIPDNTDVIVDQGAAGDGAAALPNNARGVIGWLRMIYDNLTALLNHTYSTVGPLPNNIIFGKVTITEAAVALGSNAMSNGIIIKAGTDNTGTIYLGDSTVTVDNGYPLTAGEAISLAASNTNIIYAVGENLTDTFSYWGN